MPSPSPAFDHDNPLTTRGVRLPAAGGVLSFQVHECGVVVIKSDTWNFQHVVSPFWRLYYNVRPGCAIRFDGRRIALGPTRAVIIPERVPFDCAVQAAIPHLWVHFSLTPPLGAAADAPLVVTLDEAMRGALMKLRRAVGRPAPGAELLHLSAGVLHLCLAQMSAQVVPRPTSPRLRALLELIDRVLVAPISNDMLAARVGLSTGAFLRWFRRETGVTPAAYVSGRRVREACRRLAFTDASIEEIASGVGFADRHHLSRVFKQRTGCGPARFRKGPAKS